MHAIQYIWYTIVMYYFLYIFCTGYCKFLSRIKLQGMGCRYLIKIQNHTLHGRKYWNIQIKKVKEELTKKWLPTDILNHYDRNGSN